MHKHTGDHLKRPLGHEKESEQKQLCFDSRQAHAQKKKRSTALLRSIMQAGHKEQVDIFIRHFLLETTQQKFSFDKGGEKKEGQNKAQNADFTLPLHE